MGKVIYIKDVLAKRDREKRIDTFQKFRYSAKSGATPEQLAAALPNVLKVLQEGLERDARQHDQ